MSSLFLSKKNLLIKPPLAGRLFNKPLLVKGVKQALGYSLVTLLLHGCGGNSSDTSDAVSSQDEGSTVSTESDQLVITPMVSDALLINPEIGFTDFHSYNVHDNGEPSHPETSVLYFRWYWEDLESAPDVYNTEQIDEVFSQARLLDKKVVMRFMALADMSEPSRVGIPCWLKVRVDKDPANDNDTSCSMDSDTARNMYTNEYFKLRAEFFLTEMAKRYAGREELLRIDVGMVGSWGEWNLFGWGYDNPNLGSDAVNLGNDDLEYYIDMVDRVFADTRKTMLIGSELEDMLSYATLRGMGWRADCLGDWGSNGQWSHMHDGYPNAIEHAKGLLGDNEYPDPDFDNRWKMAPVDFEICGGGMSEWLKDSEYTYDQVQNTFEWALEKHTSLINVKSRAIPDEYQPLISQVLKHLGYRFELKELRVSSVLEAGQGFTMESKWRNVGVAPIYSRYPVMFRLRGSDGAIAATFSTDIDIREWMPADSLGGVPLEYQERVNGTLPEDLASGWYALEIGIVEPNTQTAKILLGVEGAREDRWHELTTIRVNNLDEL